VPLKGERIRIIEDIVAPWRQIFSEHKRRLDYFQNAIDYRNWLAHGKYWVPNKTPYILKYDYYSICTLSEDILKNMGLINLAT
jgi:hypothetical protein